MISTANTQITQAGANAMLDAWADLFDGGSTAATLAFYEGDIPATAATAITTQTLLGTLTMHDPAFGSAASGTLTASSITAANAVASSSSGAVSAGNVFARARDSAGVTICDFRCGLTGDGSGAAISLGAATIVSGVSIAVDSLIVTLPLGS